MSGLMCPETLRTTEGKLLVLTKAAQCLMWKCSTSQWRSYLSFIENLFSAHYVCNTILNFDNNKKIKINKIGMTLASMQVDKTHISRQ